MNNSKKNLSFFTPSIAGMFFMSIFLFLSLYGGKDLLYDNDTGYHIRAGEYIIDNLSTPKNDMFSLHTPVLPWTAHEWLSEVIMATIHREFGGLTGLVIFFSVIISLIYYLIFKIIRADNGNIIISTFIVILVLVASKIHWLARPHIFSLLLMVIWYYLMDEYQYKDKNYLYVLPPIMLLWVNLHGGFVTGFMLIGIYFLGNLVKFMISTVTEKGVYKKRIKILGLTFIACLLVSLINPYGYHILLFPFKLVSDRFIMDRIVEFLSPNFHVLSYIPFEIILLLTIVVLVFSRVRLNIIELIMILLFSHMSLYSVRYIPLFSIIMAPILVKQLNSIQERSDGRIAIFLKKRSENISTIDASAKGYFWSITAAILVVVLAKYGKIDFKFSLKKNPVAAVEFIKKENLQGNMFNNDEFGDYFIYAAWPEYKVFIDGRMDMYGSDRLKEYEKVVRLKPGWDEILKKYDIKWIIYNANSPLSLLLLERDDWNLIYADKVANIFVKNIPGNQYLIEKYPDVKLVIPDPDESEK